MKLKIGMHGPRTQVKNTRGKRFCGLGAFVGVGGTQRAHVYTASALDEITADSHKQIDPVRLARELEVDMCAVNGGRMWLMDEQDVQGGDIVDFHGVKMMYGGEMTGAEMMAQMKDAYRPSLIYRNSNWIWHAGTPVHLLREPGGDGLGHAGIHAGRRPEPHPRHARPGRRQAEDPAAGLDVRDQGAGPRISRSTPPAATAGPRSSATSCTAPTRAAATGPTPARTTCRNQVG